MHAARARPAPARRSRAASRSSLVIASAPGKPVTRARASARARAVGDVEARAVAHAAPHVGDGDDLAARARAGSARSMQPTLPKPWTANVLPATSPCPASRRAFLERHTPRRGRSPLRAPRAEQVQRLAGHHRRREAVDTCEYSSMIHAITCALVLTSGAGMSRCGPMMSWIWSTNCRVSRSSSRGVRICGIDRDAALGAAEGQVHHRGLPGHQRGQAAAPRPGRPWGGSAARPSSGPRLLSCCTR